MNRPNRPDFNAGNSGERNRNLTVCFSGLRQMTPITCRERRRPASPAAALCHCNERPGSDERPRLASGPVM
jgi:hypothetical protein